MYLIRSATLNDLDALYELSSLMTFINLPHNKHELEEILINSEKSFTSPSSKKEENSYTFVVEDLATQKVLGSSMIQARHGCEEEPHYYLKVGKEHKFCEKLNTGFIHGTLKLGIDIHGYTEIGGLVLHPGARGNGEKLGKQLSFIRFFYMANHLDYFCKKTHSELMPPFDHEGKSPLWEAVGRRFMNMDYPDADILSRKNPEFILSLFPSSNIYQTLLPIEAREAIGEVGKQTRPVKNMLKKIGFTYTGEVDPFDGGPHYRCLTKNIKAIKEKQNLKFTPHKFDPQNTKECLLEIPTQHHFSAIKANLSFPTEDSFSLEPEIAKKWNLTPEMTLSHIPFNY